MNQEIDGNDYEVTFNKSEKVNTVTIKTTVYTVVKGSDSHKEAKNATEFWNSQNGKFKYQVNEADGSVTEYDVVFELDVKEVSNESKKYGAVEGAKNDAFSDKKGNSLSVLEDKDIEGGGFGATSHGEFSEIAKSRTGTDTPAHETGHFLNLGHFPEGVMKEIDKAGTITRESVVTKENVQQIIDYAIGKTEGHESTAPKGAKAKTNVISIKLKVQL